MPDGRQLAEFLILFVVFLFSATVHEFAHAYIGNRGGDRTSEDQLTLDPTPHIQREPFGMLLMPVLTYFVFGWPFPLGFASVPYDPHWAIRYPKRAAWMSLAGPASNLVLAVIAALAMHAMDAANMVDLVGPGRINVSAETLTTPLGGAAFALQGLLWLNILLGLFNLIPLMPLDGAAVLEGFVPATRGFYNRIRETPMLRLLGFMAAWAIFPAVYARVAPMILVVLFPPFLW